MYSIYYMQHHVCVPAALFFFVRLVIHHSHHLKLTQNE